MKDIQHRKDIETLVDRFYKRAKFDSEIGYIFTDIAKLDWDVHIPVICDFWETVLLDNMVYKGNPMIKHIHLNKKEQLTAQHFARWLQLWEETVRQLFAGDVADEAVKRAKNIGRLMEYKMRASES